METALRTALLDDDGRPIAASFRQVPAARVLLFDRDHPLVHDNARLRLAVVPATAGAWVWSAAASASESARQAAASVSNWITGGAWVK